MNKLFIFLIPFILFACSSDETKDSDPESYNYKVKLAFHPKLDVSCGNVFDYGLAKEFSYTLDTLDISMTCTKGILLMINTIAWENIITRSNKITHIKHLNFIDLNPSHDSYKVKKILLNEDVFSYSTSNVDLKTMPNLFINNPYVQGREVHPEQIALSTRHPNYISNITSKELYDIGSIQNINGYYYEIIAIN